jgi:hypothetical protein
MRNLTIIEAETKWVMGVHRSRTGSLSYYKLMSN